MRKLSFKWPIWLTLLAVSAPVFYVLFRVGKPEIFDTTELGEKVLGALGIVAIVWLVYGIACLLARHLHDKSTRKPWKHSEVIHIETRETPKPEQRKLEEEQGGVAETEQVRIVTPLSQQIENELDKMAHKKYQPKLHENTQEAGYRNENEIKEAERAYEIEGAGQKLNKFSAPKESRNCKKWLIIALSFIVVLATISLGGFYIIKNRLSAYLENLIEENPIYFAASAGNLQEVDRLISEGANPNAKGIKGHTPLIAATRGHHSLIAEHLLLAGANPDQKDNFGWAALHHAITPVDGADLDLISILIKHGANVNIQDNRLRTPLHRAAQYGQLQAVLLLLKCGAYPNIRDYSGWTPADRAALHPEIQSLLTSEKSNSGSQVSELTKFPEYFSEKHNFKVRFPGEVDTTDYGMVTHYTSEVMGEAAYNIFVNNYPKPVLSNEAVNAALEGNLEGRLLLFGDKAKLIESNHIYFRGFKALEYEYTVEAEGYVGYFKGTCLIVGKLGYNISVACAEQTKAIAYPKFDRFKKSFQLTDKREN